MKEQIELLKQEILALQEAHVKEVKILNDRIDNLVIELYNIKNKKVD